MCPQNFQRRGEQLTPVTPPRVGPKTLANPKPTRVGKTGGSRGRSPHGGAQNAGNLPKAIPLQSLHLEAIIKTETRHGAKLCKSLRFLF